MKNPGTQVKISLVTSYSCLVLRSFSIFDVLGMIHSSPRRSLGIDSEDNKLYLRFENRLKKSGPKPRP